LVPASAGDSWPLSESELPATVLAPAKNRVISGAIRPEEGSPVMMALIRTLLGDESGQDLVEVALLTALISIVSILVLYVLGFEMAVMFSQLRAAVG
jgi:Flp pilus assembly pilin Flp